MATFGRDWHYWRNRITGAQGWVMYNWALENSAGFMGGGLQRTTPGYVQQERDKILASWQMAKSQ